VDQPSQILRRRGLRPKRSWGQNFLKDEAVLRRIADALELKPSEVVVELGAGLGHLTQVLVAAKARVLAVERDPDMLQALREAGYENVEVLAANAARIDFAREAHADRVAVVGNLPYHLTSPILFEVLNQRAQVLRAVFTVQEEVANRLAAKPGSRAYGILTVLLGLHFELEKLFTISPDSFYPPPRVQSAVIRLLPLPRPRADISSEELFRRVVKAAFARRRKTIVNSLRSDPSLGPHDLLRGVLEGSGIDPSRRAETLSVDEFARLERGFGQATSR
jgi:16S rRNA (adenine1518-N6/adenine1519-N6)-dimethyltransferase